MTLVVMILAVAVCSSCQTYSPPPVDLDELSKHDLTESLSPDAFQGVTELTLEKARHVALSRNPSLKAMIARVEQARAVAAETSAAYWPKLNLNAEGGYTGVPDAKITTTGIKNPDWNYAAGISASYVIFDGFRRKFDKLAARQEVTKSELAVLDARRLIANAVAIAYCNAQLAHANGRIQQADLDFFLEQIKNAEARQKLGNGRESDTLGLRVRANVARAALLRNELELRTATLSLAALMGCKELPAHVTIAPLKPATKEDLGIPEKTMLLTTARSRRPDLKRAIEEVALARTRIRAAQADYLPKIELVGSYGGDRTHDAQFEKDDLGSNVGMRLSFNLFDGWLTDSRVGKAKAHELAVTHHACETILRIETEVRQRYHALLMAQKQTELHSRNLDLVRRTRDLVQTEYAKGQVSLVRLNEAQRELTSAESQLALAHTRLRLAWCELWTSIDGRKPESARH